LRASKSYPRFVTPRFEPFDPLELAKETEKIVIRSGPDGAERKYENFYAVGVYGGIATGYCVGCCLRCVFCWVSWGRDFPEKHGRFYSPSEAFTHVEESEFPLFILETNGILFGVDKDYVRKISEFTKPHIRVSLKAGTPEAFTKKTGAKPEVFEIPFQAIQNLSDHNVSFHVAAMSADPRIVTTEERENLTRKLAEIDPRLALSLEEEVMDSYNTTLARLKYANLKVKWPLRQVYKPVKELLKNRRQS